MTAEERYPSFRAPKNDREVLCAPSWETVLQGLPKAREALSVSDVTISGIRLADLSANARQALLAEAERYTSQYLDASVQASTCGPFVITGHQPELVHPGVWLKNFAASQFAKSVNGTAISLVIDNDLCRKPSIRVPTGSIEQPQVLDLQFDDSQAETPYESRTHQQSRSVEIFRKASL